MRSDNVMDMLQEALLKKAAVATITEQNVEYNTLHGVSQQFYFLYAGLMTPAENKQSYY